VTLSASVVGGDATRALMYCPGPWDERSFDLIESHRHDDLSLIAACILVAARWCRKNQDRITDVSDRVHARMAGRLCARRWTRMFISSTSVREIRTELVRSYEKT
jgi:hypothetical protein